MQQRATDDGTTATRKLLGQGCSNVLPHIKSNHFHKLSITHPVLYQLSYGDVAPVTTCLILKGIRDIPLRALSLVFRIRREQANLTASFFSALSC